MERTKIQSGVEKAIRHFWKIRNDQGNRQGTKTGKDRGSRALVTGGQQLDGFILFFIEVCKSIGIKEDSIRVRKKDVVLPGYFRPTKQWDLLIIVNGQLLAIIELKSQFGSLGNNSNNRAEEAIGSAQDFWTAYREGAFLNSPRPWLGYLFLLEDSDNSNSAVEVKEPNFEVFPEFKEASYVDRYSVLCQKLLRERLYDATALILSVPNSSANGKYSEPESEATIERFIKSFDAHVSAYLD